MHLLLTLIFACAAPLAAVAVIYSARELARQWPVIRRTILTLES